MARLVSSLAGLLISGSCTSRCLHAAWVHADALTGRTSQLFPALLAGMLLAASGRSLLLADAVTAASYCAVAARQISCVFACLLAYLSPSFHPSLCRG